MKARSTPQSSIVDGQLKAVSASQIKMFRLCERKWFYAKALRVPMKPPGKGAVLGEECHARMEHYLKTGEDVRGTIERYGDEMIAPFVSHAPFNSGVMEIEGDVTGLSTPSGVAITGRFDVLIPGDTAVIIDHKFKRDLKKWADPEEALLEDEQFIIYGAFATTRGAQTVEFRHHNHQTSGRQNKPVAIRATREEVLAKFGALCAFVDTRMVPCPTKTLDETEPNTSACSAFGGCDFAKICSASPLNRINTIFGLPASTRTDTVYPSSTGGDDMSLLNALKTVPAKAPPKTVEPVTAPTNPHPNPPPLILLVDCFSSAANDVTPQVLNLASELAKKHGVDDIRVAPKESDLAYGGWRAALSKEVRALPLHGMCYIATSELTEPAIEAISATAFAVIRGKR